MGSPSMSSYKMPKKPRYEGNKKPADPGERAGVKELDGVSQGWSGVYK